MTRFNYFVVTNEGEVLEGELCKEQAEMQIARYTELHKERSFIGHSKHAAKAKVGESRPYCIINSEDNLLDSWLTLKEAEKLLCFYLNHEEDAYIAKTSDWI